MKNVFQRIITDFHTGNQIEIIKRDIDIPTVNNKIVTIIGVRRSGKTYLLYSKIN